MHIPFNKPCLEGQEIANIVDAINTGKIAGDGKYNRICQIEIAKTIGAKRVFLTPSGTSALEMSALLYGIKPSDEIIMPSFTFVSTANAFCIFGATPIFVDIEQRTLNIDADLIEAEITDRTKAIVPVHYAGVSADMEKIRQVANKYNLKIIEDAAHGFLSTYNGSHLGTIGDVGCFSFHETKTFISGEGGAIAINNEEDVERAEIIREKGTNRSAFFEGKVDKYTWVSLGTSALPSELTAAFFYGQYSAREQIIEKRKRIYTTYHSALEPIQEVAKIVCPCIPQYCTTNYHIYFILVQDAETRSSLLAYLKDRGIVATFHYVPLHTSDFARNNGYSFKSLPITESAASRIVRLPLYNSMTREEQKYVIDHLYAFFNV